MTVAIVGVGNILMRDEGVGVRVIEELKKMPDCENFAFFDAGTSIMDLFPELDGFEKIVIVDAVRAGNKPGTIYRFKPEEVKEKVNNSGAVSLHQISLFDAISMECISSGKKLNITIIGVEPEVIETGIELSPTIKSKIAHIADIVIKEAKGLNDRFDKDLNNDK